VATYVKYVIRNGDDSYWSAYLHNFTSFNKPGPRWQSLPTIYDTVEDAERDRRGITVPGVPQQGGVEEVILITKE
jgi:hypothetical protein